jgi:2-C-methyl-D-erythritol 4-phosphate cytidylyltransferase
VTEELVSLVLEAASKYGAAAPAVPVTSTVKQAKNGMVSQNNRPVGAL